MSDKIATTEFQIAIANRNHDILQAHNDNIPTDIIAQTFGLSVRRTKRIIRKMARMMGQK